MRRSVSWSRTLAGKTKKSPTVGQWLVLVTESNEYIDEPRNAELFYSLEAVQEYVSSLDENCAVHVYSVEKKLLVETVTKRVVKG